MMKYISLLPEADTGSLCPHTLWEMKNNRGRCLASRFPGVWQQEVGSFLGCRAGKTVRWILDLNAAAPLG